MPWHAWSPEEVTSRLEVVVLKRDAPSVLDAFQGPAWHWYVPLEQRLYPIASPAFAKTHQTWLWAHDEGVFVLDVFRDLHDDQTWVCRRHPALRLPWSAVVARSSAAGTPYLAPQVVLLFKAKHARSKDLGDLMNVLPSLTHAQRSRLRAGLEQVHPGHRWLEIV